MSTDPKGLISNLQEFVVHDGPGIRVLLFLKGCPLTCRWCQNPENIAAHPEVMYSQSLCVECGRCFEMCSEGAINLQDKEHRIDRSKCTNCMRCVDVCLGTAISRVGEWISVEQAVEMIVRYRPFFSGSDHGGVTLSGGDPIFQPQFTLALLNSLRKRGIHTAIETCGFGSYESVRRLAEATDLVIYDTKHVDESSHLMGAGVSNKLILNNLMRLCKEVNTEIVIHVPLICGFNDNDEDIRKIAEFVSSLKKIKHIDLLPFNYLASGKYRSMGLQWEYAGAKRQSDKRLTELKDIVQSYGLEAIIDGLW